MDPGTFLDGVRDLLEQDAPTTAPVDSGEVIDLFRGAFFAARRAHKAAYVRAVVEGHTLSHREIGALLGYGGAGAVTGAMDGKIGDDRFALLRATVARQVPDPPRWPTPAEFAGLALIRTVGQLGERAGVGGTFGPEEYEVLRRVLRAEWLLTAAREAPDTVRASLDAVLAEVHALAGTSRVRSAGDVAAVLARWGRLYLACKRAIPGLCGQGGRP